MKVWVRGVVPYVRATLAHTAHSTQTRAVSTAHSSRVVYVERHLVTVLASRKIRRQIIASNIIEIQKRND